MEKLENSRLYPERASAGIEEKIETLQGVLSGEIPTWEMSEVERTEILVIEQELGAKLKESSATKSRVIKLDVPYLLTPEGAKEFEEITGATLPETTDMNELKQYLYGQSEELNKVSSKTLNAFTGDSIKYREAELLRVLSGTMDEEGQIDTADIPDSDFMQINLTPENVTKRLEDLRSFKSEIKEAREQLKQADVGEDYKEMLDGVYELYQRKINVLIAGAAQSFVSIAKKESLLGGEALSPAERQVLDAAHGVDDVEEVLARYDKFMTGAGGYNEEGWRTQVSEELLAFADKQEKLFIEGSLKQDEALLEKGLAKEKVLAVEIGVEKIREYCEETLKHYDLLSEIPASEYVPNRLGAAADDKWQVIISSSSQSLSVNGAQKVIKCPDTPQSIETLLTVSIAHEIEGHAIQHNNKAKIPLDLFKEGGADRSTIFAEAGAVRNEDYVSSEAFGYRSLNHPHYIRAMSTKLAGGTYADCVESFYTSAIKALQIKKESGSMTEEEFKSACTKELKTSINRSRRLFRGGSSKTGTDKHLAESAATVYLEQIQLAEKLTEAGLDQTLNLTGVNLDALVFLMRAKLLTIEDIQKPDFYALEIWDRIKSEYQLETAE